MEYLTGGVPNDFINKLKAGNINKIIDMTEGEQKQNKKGSRSRERESVSDSDDTYGSNLMTKEELIRMGHTPPMSSEPISFNNDMLKNSKLPDNIKNIMASNTSVAPPLVEYQTNRVRKDLMVDKSIPTKQQPRNTVLNETDIREIIRQEMLTTLIPSLLKEKEEEIRNKAVRDTIKELRKKGLLKTPS